MSVTSLTLLQRLRAEPTDTDWARWYSIYYPLIQFWIARVPDLAQEKEDICQEVLAAVIRDLPSFEHRHAGSFRAWLKAVTTNRIRQSVRARNRRPLVGRNATDEGEDFLDRLEDPHSDLAAEWDVEYDRQVLARLYAVVEPDFTQSTWDMFNAFVRQGRPLAEVAENFGVTPAAVIQCKSRVLRKLRREAMELLE